MHQAYFLKNRQSKLLSKIDVFLYGALTTEKLGSIVGDVTVICGAILKNYSIKVCVSKVFNGSSVATVLPHDNTDVLGIMYTLNERQMDLLELLQGQKTGLCKKKVVQVFDGQANRTVTMFTYPAPPPPHLLNRQGREGGRTVS